MGFIERLTTRRALWWDPMPPWWARQGFLLRLHRRGLRGLLRDGELHVLRSRADPDEAWRFCRLWQRTLLNKWNSREFALKHGCRVPALYWYGTDIGDLPLASLPERFVIRPTLGAVQRGVCVYDGERELLDNVQIPRSRLQEHARSLSGTSASGLRLVEEFVRSEDGSYRLPTEYKFHTFGDTIAAIEISERVHRGSRATAQLNPEWKLLPTPIHTKGLPAGAVEPPRCAEEMAACVKRLGRAFGTYVRVDYYASDQGPVFSEFSSMPMNGLYFTPFADEHLGRLWSQVYPDQV